MALIGYMEGTDPNVLSKLVADRHETIPLGNGTDGHGKYIAHLTKRDGVSIVLAYLHKLTPVSGLPSMDVMLSGCQIHNIPVLVIVPEEEKANAHDIIEKEFECVTLVSPGELTNKVKEILG